MNKSWKNVTKYFVAVFFIITNSFYADARPCGPGDRPGSNCTTNPNGIPVTADNGSGIQDQSKSAAGSNAGGSMLGMIGIGAGAAAIAAGMASCPTCNWGLIALGIAAIAAGSGLMSNHGAAGAGAVNSGLTATVGGGGITADEFNSRLPGYAEMQKSVEGLKGLGVKVNTKTGAVTLPNGKTLSAADASNAEKLSEALGTSIDQSSLNSGLKGLMAKAQEKADAQMKDFAGIDMNGLDGGAGGGGARSGFTPYISDLKADGTKKDLDRGPADVKGLQKKYGDSFIGVANDDIFTMMNRRYNLKSSQDTFILLNPMVKK